jgi:hypothetical protein
MSLAVLSIDLIAKLASYEQSMKAATTIAQQSAQKMEGAFSKANTAVKGLFAGITVGTFIQITKASIEGLDALNDMADATGASIENLSAIEDIAVRTGTSMESATGSIVRLNRALIDTKVDPKTLEVFKMLGLSADDLRKLDPAQALMEVAKAFSQFEDDGNKARAAQVLFGKSLQEVAPLLKDMAERGELIATTTTEQAKAAEAFANSVRSLTKDLADLSRGFVGQLLPFLQDMADAWPRNEQGARDFGTAVKFIAIPLQTLLVLGSDVVFVFDRIQGQVGQFMAQIAAIARGDFEGVKAIREAFAADSEQARKDLDAFQAAVMGQKRAEADLQRRLEDRGFTPSSGKQELGVVKDGADKGGVKSLEKFSPAVPRALSDALSRLEGTDPAKIARLNDELLALVGLMAAGDDSQGLRDAISGLREELDKLDPAANKARKNAEIIKSLTDATPAAKRAEAMKNIALLREEYSKATNPEQLLRLNQALAEQYDLIGAMPDIMAQAADEMTVFAEQASRNIQDALGDTLYLTLSGKFDSIGDLWKQLLLRMAAEAAAARIGKWLFGVGADGGGGKIGDLFKLIGGLGGGGASGNLSEFASGFAGAFAAGGSIPAGRWGLVGEKGVEIARGPATITPLQAVRGRAVTWAPTINVSGDVGPGTVALVERMLARERSRMMRVMA